MEERNEVKIVKVDFKCPQCPDGHLRPTGTVLTSYPPQYPHMCDSVNCDYGQTFSLTYPYIDYVPINVVTNLTYLPNSV